MVINTNLSAQWATTRLQNSSGALAQSLQRLSSGSKITSPADDSAGLAVSMKLGAEILRLGAAQTNIGNAMSFVQTQDGYLQKVGEALKRMSELSVLSLDVTKADGDRALYQQEFQSLGSYISDLASKDFNGVSLFTSQNLYVTTAGDIDPGIVRTGTMTMIGINLTSVTYTTASTADISTTAHAATALGKVKEAIAELGRNRGSTGADLERLGFYQDQLMSLKNNLSAANSRITDVDVAEESTRYAKWNILVQSGTAMLAQANSQPQAVLKLLGG